MTHNEAVTVLFRQASFSAHPDRGGSNQAMAQVNEAAAVLRGTPPKSACRERHCMERAPAERVMPWGKWQGHPMSELPLSYLGWLAENSNNLAIRGAARLHLHAKVAS